MREELGITDVPLPPVIRRRAVEHCKKLYAEKNARIMHAFEVKQLQNEEFDIDEFFRKQKLDGISVESPVLESTLNMLGFDLIILPLPRKIVPGEKYYYDIRYADLSEVPVPASRPPMYAGNGSPDDIEHYQSFTALPGTL